MRMAAGIRAGLLAALALGLASGGCLTADAPAFNQKDPDGGKIDKDATGDTEKDITCVTDPNGECVECSADSDCTEGVCHPEIGACVQCVADADCGGGVCDPATSVCVACVQDSDCPNGVCADGGCVECMDDSDCPGGTCNPTTNGCVGPCNADADCDDGNACTTDICNQGSCLFKNAADGTACDDGDPCTTAEVCAAGQCVGQFDPAACCPPVANCPAPATLTDTDGDGCLDTCICPDGGEMGPDGCVVDCPAIEIVCPDGAVPVDSDGDGCKDTCECATADCQSCTANALLCNDADPCTKDACVQGVCTHEKIPNCGECPPFTCDENTKPFDTNGDGCPDTCLCPDGNLPDPATGLCTTVQCASDADCDNGTDGCFVGFCVAGICKYENTCCDTPIVCPPGTVGVDKDGDGCPDTCLCPDGTQPDPATGKCVSSECSTDADCPQPGAPCMEAQCIAGACVLVNVCCNDTIVCGPDQKPVDTDGDGCPDTCLCPDGNQPGPDGQCSGSGTKMEICIATGGKWDPSACGDYWCGQPNDCLAVIPGCDCGPDANYVEGVGCQKDPACGGVGDDPQLCEATGGTWYDASCPYICGKPTDNCFWLGPTCDCGPDANFISGVGCVTDPTCGGTSDDAQLCVATGGTWDPTSCGNYYCGQFPDCDAVIPGCNCGKDANFVAGAGCQKDPVCGGVCDPIGCPPNTIPVDTDGDGCDDTCECINPDPNGSCGCPAEILCPPGYTPVDTDGDGCNDTCECLDPTFCGGSKDQQLCEDTGGKWDPSSCGNYYCGQPPLCLAIIPGCDCGPAANFFDGVGCMPDPNCEGSNCDPPTCAPGSMAVDTNGDGCADTCECVQPNPDGTCSCPVAISCAAGTAPVDTDGDGCEDTCNPTCADTCDCYEADAGFANECALKCLNCGNFWQCDAGVCKESCGPIPDDAMQCMIGTDPTACTSNDQCASGYCAKDPGVCDSGLGKCTPSPTGCDKLSEPVCGCDGNTYPNACSAGNAGVNVSYKGQCTAGNTP